MTKTFDEQTATAREAIAAALDGMARFGVSDQVATREIMGLAITLARTNPQAVDAEDVIRLALALIGGMRGGPLGIAGWAEAIAAQIRANPHVPPPPVIN